MPCPYCSNPSIAALLAKQDSLLIRRAVLEHDLEKQTNSLLDQGIDVRGMSIDDLSKLKQELFDQLVSKLELLEKQTGI